MESRDAGQTGYFNGSLRFVERPGEDEFRALSNLGVEFFDYGRGRAGSRTVYPVRIPFAAVDKLKKLDFLVSIECARPRRARPPLAQSRPQV